MNEYLEAIKAKLTKTPFSMRDDLFTLVIGLGGSGVPFAAATKKLLVQRYGAQKVNEQMDFVCLDTDESKLPKEIINESEFIRLKGLHHNEWVNGWLNPDILKQRQDGELTENDDGAAGIRMLGRWKLFSSAHTIMQKFNTIINKYSGKQRRRRVNVIIMAGLCGGTGCGTFIDIPYFVRKAVQSNGGIDEQTVFYYGMLELPDSKIDRSSMNQHEKDYCRFNAYAAMMDIEYFMRKDTEYTASFHGGEVLKTKKPIFHQCFLLSDNAFYDYGRFPRNEGSTIHYLAGAIPEAINIMVSHVDGEDEEHNMLGFDSKMSNIQGQPRFKDALERDRIVATFGVSKVEIPKDQIILAIFARVFLSLRDRWEKMEDTELMDNVVENSCDKIFKIPEYYETFKGLINVSSMSEKQLSSTSFRADLDALINGLSTSDTYKSFIKDIRATLEETINDIYATHGPFFALKIFEKGYYDAYLDDKLEEIKPNTIKLSDLSSKAAVFADLTNKWLKETEKKEAKKKLLEVAEAYKAYKIYLLWEKQIEAFKEEIAEDYHSKVFQRVTEMVKQMRAIFHDLTGIESSTGQAENTGTTIFTWSFSDVKYDEVIKKINFLFSKKICYTKSGTNGSVVTKSDIYPVENGRTNKDKPLHYWAKRERPLVAVEYTDNEGTTKRVENVTSIEEVIQFADNSQNPISMEEIVKSFLLKIKEDKNAAISTIIADTFKDVIALFNNVAFTDMIILSSPKVDISKPISDLTEEQRKKHFKEAVERYYKYAWPSYPIHGQFEGEIIKSFAVALEPEIKKPYDGVLESIQAQKISQESTQRIPIKESSTMITVNFYFGYGFDWYTKMADCKEQYDKVKDTWPGLHIAEGSQEDIRPYLRELV